MKKRGKSSYLSVITFFLSYLLATSIASAAVDQVIGVPWQGDVNKAHTAVGSIPGGAVPDSLTFEFLDTNCSWAGNWQVYLNDILVATVPTSASCTCSPGVHSYTVSNAALVASGAWNTTSGNTYRAYLAGSPYYSWARVKETTGSAVNSICIGDYNGGDCTVTDLCSANYTNGPVTLTSSSGGDLANTLLKGVIKTTNSDQIWYKWSFGDGTESAVTSLSGATKYKVEAKHVYAGATGTPYTAKLQVSNSTPFVLAKESPYHLRLEDNTLDARINIAIDKGLWYLYKNPNNTGTTFDGSASMSWRDSGYGVYASPTASAIQAFAINNHKIKGDATVDPYVEAVQLGMNYLMKGNQSLVGVTGLADGNNSVGIKTNYANHQIYEGGQVMDAIIASGALPADLTGRSFAGSTSNIWSYGQVLQDLADMYLYYQHANGAYGEWDFGSGENDNSSSQWAAIGMFPAQAPPWNITIPASVKTKTTNWVHTSYCPSGSYAGSFGYQGACQCNDACYNTTPCGLMQLNFSDVESTDAYWAAGAKYMADHWWGLLQDGSAWGNQKTYGFYSFVKGMRLAQPAPVEQITKSNGQSFDWYRGGSNLTNTTNFDKGLAVRILEIQNADGHWIGNLTGDSLTTAWMIIALKPTLFAAAPSACFSANPKKTYSDADITFDPNCSSHTETGKTIANLTKFEWDWNNDGVYDETTTTPTVMHHSFTCANPPCTFPVKLKVSDDADPALTHTKVDEVMVTNPPHPPVANAGGPYVASLCAADTLVLDGSKSLHPDQGLFETNCTTCVGAKIVKYDWDLQAPLNFDAVNASSNDPAKTAAVTPASFFASAGAAAIALRVTDNAISGPAFPGSGLSGDQTGTAFGSVDVKAGCLCTITARAKTGMVQLNWAAAEHTATTAYNIYRSTEGPNTGFTKIRSGYTNAYPLFVDTGLTNGKTYYYRVEKVLATGGTCGSKAVSGKPMALTLN